MSTIRLLRAPTSNLSVVRARAAAHELELDVSVRYLTPQDLSDRWGLSLATVRAIGFDELPYIAFGRGSRLKRRRYNPHDVAAYEARYGVGGHAA